MTADSPLHRLFERQAADTPDRTAVTYGDLAVSYRELDERANQIAHHLASVGIARGMLVAVYLERSIDLVAAIVGVLKAGAAYVPIDADTPPERCAFILGDASAPVVLTQARLIGRLPESRARAVVVDGPDVLARSRVNLSRMSELSDPAYVIYTSGSTGMPKGVLVEHRSIVGLFRGVGDLYEFRPDDVWTMFHSPAFDMSVWEMWGALVHGASLVVVPRVIARSPDDFRELCARERATVLSLTPSAFLQFIRADQTADGTRVLALRYVVLGGEALEFRTVRPWFDAHGDVRPQVVNMYGITETTVHVTFRPVTRADVRQDDARSLIGWAIPGYRICLLDDQRRPIARGEKGEIWVGGVGVARGYLNRPELTAERFVADGVETAAGEIGDRLYRSGDLGRELANGDIEYLGRIDHQVKVRGFRVEPGEIESALAGHAAVAQAIVLMRDGPDDEKRLVAYWVAHSGVHAAAGELRAHVAARLPDYMVPALFVELNAMPLTLNGKIDRQALPTPDNARPEVGSVFAEPRDEMESALSAIWSDVLAIDRVGINDSFFELGGHSLLAVRMAAQIHVRLGVRLSLSQIFDQPTVAALAAVLRTHQPAASLGSPSAVGSQSVTRRPMSFTQRGLWFLHQVDNSQRAYLLTDAWELSGKLDVEALRQALHIVVERHAPLRTRFASPDGEPLQIVGGAGRFELTTWDLTSLSGVVQRSEIDRVMASESDRPFDLAHDLLMRAGLAILAADRHVLIVTVHHIASDAWSQQLFRRELEALYESCRSGAPSPLAALPIQYADFADRQAAAMTSERESELRRVWSRQLEGLPPLDLPGDRRRAPNWNGEGAEHIFRIVPALAGRLQRLATANRATLQMLLLAAYQLLVARYSGQTDFGVATPSAGRTDPDVEHLIGLFVNVLVLRADLSGAPSFVDLLERVRAASLTAYDHQDLPFEMLVAELQPARDRSRSPLAQVMFQFLPMSDDPPSLAGMTVTTLRPEAQRVRFDLEMSVWRGESGLRGVLGYSTRLFDKQTAERLAGHFVTLLEAIADGPDRACAELSLLDVSARHEQLVGWSGIAEPPAELGCVHELFDVEAARAPDAIAIVSGDRRITYGELLQRSNALVRHLRAAGVREGAVVAIHLDRSIDLIVAMLGVLKCGAAYLPLDPTYPVERLRSMMRQADAGTLITDAHVPPALTVAARVVDIDNRTVGDQTNAAIGGAACAGLPADRAYVMFTSGSTGQPKGVVVPHRAVTRLVRGTNYVHLQPTDRVAQASNASFDASTLEIWGALLNGASLVIVDRETLLSPAKLGGAIRDQGVSVLFLTPAVFQQAVAAFPAMFSTLRYLVVGGDVVDPAAVRVVLEAGPPEHLLNGYGPTENTTFSTCYDITAPPDEGATVPIGRPIASSTCYVLDHRRALLPVGAAGELYVGGAGLANGYVGSEELTAERFVPHPFVEGDRLYRTGDWVQWRWNGQLEFLGRMDRQVKLRGIRIEPAEIEMALTAHPQLREACVVLREDVPGDPRLVAYIVAQGESPASGDVVAMLRQRLPDAMIPAAFVTMPALPLTRNGKVDRDALPPPAANVEAAAGFAAPRGNIELHLVKIWEDLLSRRPVGVRDNFFDVGGHSLMAVKLMDRIEALFNRRLPLDTLWFRGATIETLAAILREESATGADLVQMKGGSQSPLFVVPTMGGHLFHYHDLVRHLGAEQPVYGVQARGVYGTVQPDATIEAIARRSIESMRSVQPQGPYLVAGFSSGGVVAFEIAQQLAAAGEPPALLVMVDTFPPAPAAGSWPIDALTRAPQSLLRLLRPNQRLTVGDAHAWAHRTYRPRPYDHPIEFFVADSSADQARRDDLGWIRWVPRGVRVHRLPGEHGDLVKPPVVRQLAALLDACVRSATLRSPRA